MGCIEAYVMSCTVPVKHNRSSMADQALTGIVNAEKVKPQASDSSNEEGLCNQGLAAFSVHQSHLISLSNLTAGGWGILPVDTQYLL